MKNNFASIVFFTLFATLQVFAADKIDPRLCDSKLQNSSARAADRRTGARTSLLSPSEIRSNARAEFIAKYKNKKLTTREQNRSWMNAAENTSSRGTRLELTLENADMKEMNSTYLDKDFVTSLTNFMLIIFQDELRTQDSVEEYADYKLLRDTQEISNTEYLSREYEENARIFGRVCARYDLELAQMQIMRASEHPSRHFRMGMALTSDQADFAARNARDNNPENKAGIYDEALVAKANQILNRIESLRQQLAQRFNGSPLLEPATSSARPTLLDLEVFALARKSEDATQLLEALTKTFPGQPITIEDANVILEYKTLVDKFSPGLRIEERVHLNLDEATLGGFTADRMGLGALNLQAVAKALSQSRHVDEALIQARVDVDEVTKNFKLALAKFKSIAGDFVDCSGDDCAGIADHLLTDNEKQELLSRLAADPQTLNFRIAFFPENVQKNIRKELSFAGETIESMLRSNLRGVFDLEKTRQMIFAVDVLTNTLGIGPVKLYIGSSRELSLSQADLQILHERFKVAIESFNKQKNTKYFTASQP